MSNLRTDIHYIKWGLLALLCALATGGTAVMFSQHFLDNAQQAYRNTENQLSAARRNLATAIDDQQNMATYTQEYSMLLNRHVIGSEQRLDWIDGLERLRQRNIVLGFTYTISPQMPYTPPVALDSGSFALNRSDMKISFQLLHEGQLINFFKALRTNVKGWYMLDGCTIDRLDSTSERSESDATPHLKAECKGGWLTLKNRSTP